MNMQNNNSKDFTLNLTSALNHSKIIQQQLDTSRRAIESTMLKKEKEELRRHNEMISALKEAGDKGATIIIGDNAKDIQIQQNSAGAQQTMTNHQGLNYDQVLSILLEIKEYFDFPQFERDFGNSSESLKDLINATIQSVSNNEDETLITKSLRIIRDVAINASGGLISSGIITLLNNIKF